MEEHFVKVPLIRAAGKDREYWANIISQWKESNEKQKIFCARLGIKLGTFSYWRFIFGKNNKREKTKKEKSKKELNFIPLKLTNSINSKSNKIIIKSKNGTKIIVSENSNIEIAA